MAVAARFVLGERDLDAAAPAGADVGREGGDVGAAGAAVHAVIAVVAMDEVVVAGAAADRVDPEAARRLVASAGPAHHMVVAEVADDDVEVAGAAVDGVVAAPAVDEVAAGPAADDVVAEAGEDLVVPGAAVDDVAARGAAEEVGLVGPLDRDPGAVAAQDLLLVRRDGAQGAAREEQRDEPRRHRGRSHAVPVRHPQE